MLTIKEVITIPGLNINNNAKTNIIAPAAKPSELSSSLITYFAIMIIILLFHFIVECFYYMYIHYIYNDIYDCAC